MNLFTHMDQIIPYSYIQLNLRNETLFFQTHTTNCSAVLDVSARFWKNYELLPSFGQTVQLIISANYNEYAKGQR